jgi:hypothetical protein
MSNINDPIERVAFTKKEFCARYRICLTSVWYETKAGRLRPVKIGAKVLIPVAEAERWFAARTGQEA